MFSDHKIKQVYLPVLVAVLALGLLSGCKPPPVSPPSAADICPSMGLTCVDGATSVEVELPVGGPSGPDVHLSGGNELVAVANGQSIVLEEQRKWPNVVLYTGRFGFDDPGTQVTITLQGPAYPSAPHCEVALPQSMVVLEPQSGATFTRQDNIRVSWQPSGEVAIGFRMDCQGGQQHVTFSRNYVSGSGSEIYSVNDLLSNSGLEASATCTANITLVRTTKGTGSAEYRSASITAQRETSVSVQMTP